MQIIGSIFMSHWSNKFIIMFFVLLFSGCERNVVFTGTSDEIIESYNKFNPNDLIEVTGEIAWIEYPKDGSRLNECAISIKTSNTTNIIKREGDVVCCKMKYRVNQNETNNKIRIKGKYEKYTKSDEGNYLYLKNCIVIQ